MVGKHANQKVGSALLLLLALPPAACRPQTTSGKAGAPAAGAALPRLPYQSGDVLCRFGTGFFSKYFRQYAGREQLYSHVGIVAVSRDSVFVYHAEASELTGVGRVLKEPVATYLAGTTTCGLYRLQAPADVRQQVMSQAARYYQRHTPFDLDFDAAHDDAVYCTELAADCLNYATRDSTVRPSLRGGLHHQPLYAVDDVYANGRMRCVWRQVKSK